MRFWFVLAAVVLGASVGKAGRAQVAPLAPDHWAQPYLKTLPPLDKPVAAPTRFDVALQLTRAVDSLTDAASSPNTLAVWGDLLETFGTEMTAFGVDLNAARSRLNAASENTERTAPPRVRFVTNASQVVAVYVTQATEAPALVVALWGNGTIIWSHDRLRGGPPFRQGKADPARFVALVDDLTARGVWAEGQPVRTYKPASTFTTLYVRNKTRRLTLCSPHELVLNTPAPTTPDERRFRTLWSILRAQIAPLLRTLPNTTIQGSLEFVRPGKTEAVVVRPEPVWWRYTLPSL